MRPLRRPDKSEAEIAHLPPAGTTQWSEYVRRHGSAFAAETLVYLMREALAHQDTLVFEMCGRFLLGRATSDGRWTGGYCEPIIASIARANRFNRNSEVMKDFRARCLAQAFRAVQLGREKKPFWEERFGRAFKNSCVDIARSLHTLQERASGGTDGADEEHEVDVDALFDSETPCIDDAVAAKLSIPHHQRIVLAAIRALPPRQGQAAVLRWIEGRQIEGDGDDSITTIMGITPRAVHAHLAKALATLRADASLRRIWHGEI